MYTVFRRNCVICGIRGKSVFRSPLKLTDFALNEAKEAGERNRCYIFDGETYREISSEEGDHPGTAGSCD